MVIDDKKKEEALDNNLSIQKIVNDKPNSFEIGKAQLRHKIYYGEIDELRQKLIDLEGLGLIDFAECNLDLTKLGVTKGIN